MGKSAIKIMTIIVIIFIVIGIIIFIIVLSLFLDEMNFFLVKTKCIF